MPSQPPIPPLLSPYLSSSPSNSLTLSTSTLGASTNWLVSRFLYVAFESWGADGHDEGQSCTGATRVVLVSWLRDAKFWTEGGRKLGVNFQKVQVVDALESGLGLGADGIAHVEAEIIKIVAATNEATEDGARVLLVLDGLDFLLAATGCAALQILEVVGALREHAHSILVTSGADLPFTQSQATPLEISQAAFVVSMAHQARLILSVRGLDTGVARDVSGVLRISKGGAFEEEDGEIEERECLYFVGGDGGVRVSERGL